MFNIIFEFMAEYDKNCISALICIRCLFCLFQPNRFHEYTNQVRGRTVKTDQAVPKFRISLQPVSWAVAFGLLVDDCRYFSLDVILRIIWGSFLAFKKLWGWSDRSQCWESTSANELSPNGPYLQTPLVVVSTRRFFLLIFHFIYLHIHKI